MTRQIDLRWSKAEDYEFALNLHLLAMRPYSEELIVWDEAKQRESFAVRRAANNGRYRGSVCRGR